ncbi:glutenin, low molecular weight subunit [Drosophila rhopaloa]|uniref:Glutenin, low molecular weight subunit n=1 Tax=Drosophila rhopaloa TaxID=1041015 RepID=A0A6P4F2U9_DRORH|nr:glutenin, low molecular weight subunit [Drosophila rhopaloa]
MPKKVITRRQRKAAESKRKAEEESNQNLPGVKAEEPMTKVGNQTAHTAPASYDLLETKKDKEMSKTTSGRNIPCSNQAVEKSNEPCYALQKIIAPGQRKSLISAVKKSALDLEQVLTTSTWYDQNNESTSKESKIKSKETEAVNEEVPTNSVLPLVAKICKQIKSHLHTVLPKRNSSQQQKPKGIQQQIDQSYGTLAEVNDFLLERSNEEIHVGVLNSLEQDPPQQDQPQHDPSQYNPPQQDPSQQDQPQHEPPQQDPPLQNPHQQNPPQQDPSQQDPCVATGQNHKSGSERNSNFENAPPLKLFGNTGYFVLTGTNDQLAQQLGDLAARNIAVQCLSLPSDMIEKAEEQLAELERNREQILERMRNKHAILAQPRAPRQKNQRKYNK